MVVGWDDWPIHWVDYCAFLGDRVWDRGEFAPIAEDACV
jgi:hypothetical protein